MVQKPGPAVPGRLCFAPPAPVVVARPERSRGEKVKKPKRKNDPKLVAAARELRDKWLERVNAPGGNALLVGSGKYDVARALSVVEGRQLGGAEAGLAFGVSAKQMRQLAA